MVAEKLSAEKTTEQQNNNLTISTKLSTDQLICKSPQISSREGSQGSLKSFRNHEIPIKEDRKRTETPTALYLGVLQILFGLLMAVFGVLVLVHNANMSQIGGGLWGGCVVTLTGVIGVLSAAKDCCPLKHNPQRIVLTIFLAMSLVSLAVTNLTLVLAAIGLTRDAAKLEESTENNDQDIHVSSDEDDHLIPSNYASLLTGVGLLLVSGCECVAAALSAYHCARVLCPCFKSAAERDCTECGSQMYAPSTGKEMLVSSWLGKQTPPPLSPGMQPVYVVTTNNRQRRSPMIYPLTTPPASLISPPVVGYPLIPAPLGSTPPPILHTRHHHPQDRIHRNRRKYPNDRQLQCYAPKTQETNPKKQKKSREKQKTITEEEIAKTYKGLDRTIAEEFIEICDSTRTTSGSDSSGCTNSDLGSSEIICEKL